MTKLHELVYHCTLPSQKHIFVKNSIFIVDSDVENMNFIYVNISQLPYQYLEIFTRL